MGRELTAAALAKILGARLEGDASHVLTGAAELEGATEGEIAFFADPRRREALRSTRAGAVLLRAESVEGLELPGVALLICEQPDLAFARVLEHFHPRHEHVPGIDPSARVEPSARVHPEATVMALAYVGARAVVGARTVLHPQAHVAADARVGKDCHLHPHSVIGERCVVGNRVILHAGAVLGTDGFGYVLEETAKGPRHHKMPQVGIVRVEDEVEIGAGSCVDRATLGETLIGRGSKIDNQVQVGHNCVVGPLSILCGQVGLAGSTLVGKGAVLAGGVGVSGHVTIGNGARVGAGSGVLTDVPAGETWTGYPASPHKGWLRASVALKRLPELLGRVRALERRLTGSSDDD